MMSRTPERRPRLTVGDLVRMLGSLDQSLPVVVNGYESGYQTPDAPRVMSMGRDPDGGGMFGDFNIGEADAFPVVALTRDGK